MSSLFLGREASSFVVRSAVELAHPRDEVFEFFSKAENLEQLTPKHLKFSILNDLPVQMHQGALIDYKLKLYGVSFGWTSEITVWEPPFRFVDEQVRGPYAYWIHEHLFEDNATSTIVKDHVRYHPRGGALVNHLFVARDIAKIFAYREAKLLEFFPA